MLVYDDSKSHRPGRRLPIPAPTAGVIAAQQQRVRLRFPDTPVKELRLLPSPARNPHGKRPISSDWVAAATGCSSTRCPGSSSRS